MEERTPLSTHLPRFAPKVGATPEGNTPSPGNHVVTKLTTSEFSRCTHTALYHIITRHAFTGACIQIFYPHHTLEQIARPCGEPIQTVEQP